ncbi:DUF4131 domain-containing protein, partial [Myxococcota bacterium]
MTRAPIIVVFAALGVGVGLADLIDVSTVVVGIVLAATLAVLGVASRAGRGVMLAAVLVLTTVGALSSALQEVPEPIRLACEDPSNLWRAEVAGPTERVPSPVSAEHTQRVEVDLVAQRCGGTWTSQRGRVRLRLWSGPNVARGDIVQARIVVVRFEPPRNPTDLDTETWARRHGLAGHGRVLSPHVLVARAKGPIAWLDHLRARVA